MGWAMRVSVDAVQEKNGHVVCHLDCDGQKAEVTFTGTEVIFEVPEPAQPEGQ